MNDQPRATTGLAIRTGLLACILGLVLVGGSSFAAGQTAVFDGHAGAGAAPRFKAIAFDYLVLFNADSVVTEVERVFPGRGVELANLWRTRQFEYSWLRSMSGRYVDFLAITSDALVYAAHALNLELTAETKQQLLDAYLRLSPWPDTVDALRRLKASGIHIITIANFSWCTRRSWRVRIAILSPQNGPNIVDLRRLFGSTRVELVHGGEPISTARKWVSRPVYPRFRARSRERRRIQPASQFFR